MSILSTLNTLKFSEIAVQNAQKNINQTLGTYLFLAGQLESFPDLNQSENEKTFLSISKTLMFNENWPLASTVSYIDSINQTEISLQAEPGSLNQTTKKTLFAGRHIELLVSIQSYNLTVQSHNQKLTTFPYSLFVTYTHSQKHPQIPVPQILKTIPFKVSHTSL